MRATSWKVTTKENLQKISTAVTENFSSSIYFSRVSYLKILHSKQQWNYEIRYWKLGTLKQGSTSNDTLLIFLLVSILVKD